MIHHSLIRIRQNCLFFFIILTTFSYGQRGLDTVLFNRADSLVNAGKYLQAVETYQLFINSGSADKAEDWEKISNSWNNIGVCYYLLQEFDKAAASFEVALEIDRENEFESFSERLSNLGMVFKKQGYFNRAISYYEEALNLAEEKDDKVNIAIFLNNIGSIYDAWGQYDKAIEYFEKSLRIKELSGNKRGIAKSLNNIGMVYHAWKKHDQAIANFKEALLLNQELGEEVEEAVMYNNIGLSFYDKKNYDSAQVYFFKALDINIELGNKDQVATQYNNLGMIHLEKQEYDRAGNYIQMALKIYEEQNQKANMAMVLSNLGYNEGLKKNFTQAIEYLERSTQVAREINLRTQLQKNYFRISDLYASMKRYDQALEYYKKASEIKDSVFTHESHEQIADFEVKYETERKQKEIEILQQKELISNLQLHRQKILRNSLIGIITLIFLLASAIFYVLRVRIRDSRIIAAEKAKTDQLLLTILPEKVANDLKEEGKTIPENFENVTVFFSDLCNFTDLSSGLKPEYIINELNQIFSKFDEIIEKHHGERIKTIGDAYMAVCGLPIPNPGHAEHLVSAAVEMLEFMEERRKLSPVKWQIRIGIHSGSVVAGVVGVKKYIYDVFGDTVNTASRMESYSAPMKINISETTYHLVKDKFSFTESEAVEIKGKGMMKMYFVGK